MHTSLGLRDASNYAGYCTREPYSVIRVTSPAPERSQDITNLGPPTMAGLSFLRRLESAHPTALKNGILTETDGSDIFHKGVNRTFRDIEQVAIDSAICG